jgi:hypothetical protein
MLITKIHWYPHLSFFKQHVYKAESFVLSLSVYKKPQPVRSKFTATNSMLPSHISKPSPTGEGGYTKTASLKV